MNETNQTLNGHPLTNGNGNGHPLAPVVMPEPHPSANGNGRPEGHPVLPSPLDPAPPNPTDELPATSLAEKQLLLAHLVKMLVRKVTFGLFVAGSSGSGKSYTISRTLAAEGVNPILLNSHVTPMSLYQTLYEHRTADHVLWIDDADSLYGSLVCLGELRAALYPSQGERVVTYNSTALKNLPSRFTFEGRIIMCANSFPKNNEAFKAVLTRIDTFNLCLTNEEVIEHMRLLAAQGFDSLPPETCNEVIDFISASGGTRQLSMRMFEPSMRKVVYAQQNGIDWQPLVLCQLEQVGAQDQPKALDSRRHLLNLVARAIQTYPGSTEEQRKWFCKGTRKSRATFFRLKRELERNHERGVIRSD